MTCLQQQQQENIQECNVNVTSPETENKKKHEEHTQVYLGVSRFSWSFTLLENMSCFQGEVEAVKSHYRSFKLSPVAPRQADGVGMKPGSLLD